MTSTHNERQKKFDSIIDSMTPIFEEMERELLPDTYIPSPLVPEKSFHAKRVECLKLLSSEYFSLIPYAIELFRAYDEEGVFKSIERKIEEGLEKLTADPSSGREQDKEEASPPTSFITDREFFNISNEEFLWMKAIAGDHSDKEEYPVARSMYVLMIFIQMDRATGWVGLANCEAGLMGAEVAVSILHLALQLTEAPPLLYAMATFCQAVDRTELALTYAKLALEQAKEIENPALETISTELLEELNK